MSEGHGRCRGGTPAAACRPAARGRARQLGCGRAGRCRLGACALGSGGEGGGRGGCPECVTVALNSDSMRHDDESCARHGARHAARMHACPTRYASQHALVAGTGTGVCWGPPARQACVPACSRSRRGHRHASPHALAAGAAARRSTYTHYIAHAAHRPTGCAAPCSAGAHRCPPWRCSARAGVHPPAIPQGRSPAAPCECNSQSSCALHLASRHH